MHLIGEVHGHGQLDQEINTESITTLGHGGAPWKKTNNDVLTVKCLWHQKQHKHTVLLPDQSTGVKGSQSYLGWSHWARCRWPFLLGLRSGSFPPCRSHPAWWVSRTQKAPGVWSLSAADRTLSCRSDGQSRVLSETRAGETLGDAQQGADTGKQRVTDELLARSPWGFSETAWRDKSQNRYVSGGSASLRGASHIPESCPAAAHQPRPTPCLCGHHCHAAAAQQRTPPLAEWTSGSPAVSPSLLQARLSSADCSSPPTGEWDYRWVLTEGLLLRKHCGWAWLMSQVHGETPQQFIQLWNQTRWTSGMNNLSFPQGAAELMSSEHIHPASSDRQSL